MSSLSIDATGRLVGPWSITYNDPFPTVNGSNTFAEPAWGYVLHTEVGYEHSVIQEFNDPNAQASSFFSIGMDGHVHQYGPVGKGWKAWTQAAGNPHYRATEHEDMGDPSKPFSPKQVEATSLILEAVSKHDGFPLVATSNPNGGRGVLLHSDGGQAWGGHHCPGDVRAKQRDAIVARAQAIRGGAKPAPNPPPLGPGAAGLVKALQAAVHLPQDGQWGPNTDGALNSVRTRAHSKQEQAAVGVAQDGVWGPRSANAEGVTTMRIQAALSVAQDGAWGPKTESAYQAARAKNHH